jgi:DNA repair protein RadC
MLEALLSDDRAVPSVAMRELPVHDRPRERLHRLGAEQLSTAELLAILLGSGRRGASALDLGYRLLARVGGSLGRLAARPIGDLTRESGVGTARAIRIHAALELGRRAVVERADDRPPVRGPLDVVALLGPRLRHLPVEELHVLLLDSQHRLQRDVLVTRGSLDATPVQAREVFREAIADAAAAVILVHNHPSGDPTPSPDDIAVTGRLARSGRDLGIPVCDHVIIGAGRHASWLEQGWD